MASNDNNDEKPNLRPTKRINAGGKSIFLHHNPNQPSSKSYIHATWTNTNDKQDPFGIEQPNVEYSLNKQQRWEVLNDFRRHIANQSSSSSDDERDVQSDSEQSKKKKTRRRKDLNAHQTKYRLYEFHNTEQQANCVSITSNTGQQRIQTPRRTYMQGPASSNRLRQFGTNQINANDNRQEQAAADVTYFAVVPPPKEKQLANIRKQHGTKRIYLLIVYQYNL